MPEQRESVYLINPDRLYQDMASVFEYLKDGNTKRADVYANYIVEEVEILISMIKSR
jgi:hypothetical protein